MSAARWGWPVAVGLLLLALAVTSVGWWQASRPGPGRGPGCYELLAGDVLRVLEVQGAATVRSSFSVSEDRERVVLGYGEQVSPGLTSMEGYPVAYEVDLKVDLGDRPVVDPAGGPVPECR